MTKTQHYQLNQWDAGDRVLREDFNEDNRQLEKALSACGNCRMEHKTYVGTGISGPYGDKANSLTFQQRPLLVIILGKYSMYIPGTVDRGDTNPLASGGNAHNSFYWRGNKLTWNNYDSAAYQLNEKGITYHYLAFYLTT